MICASQSKFSSQKTSEILKEKFQNKEEEWHHTTFNFGIHSPHSAKIPKGILLNHIILDYKVTTSEEQAMVQQRQRNLEYLFRNLHCR